MNEKDRLFATEPFPPGSFVFDDRVVRVFPDMINRSVPGYGLMLQMIGLMARRYAQDDRRIFDLGCSLGAATLAMHSVVRAANVRFVAVDNSAAMMQQLRTRLEEDQQRAPEGQSDSPIELRHEDICLTEINHASVTVLNLTLQFVDPARRAELLGRIGAGTLPGGILLLTEKIRFEDPAEQDIQTELYHDFKRAQGYSELEIAEKRNALERVLQPDSDAQHRQRLLESGWVQSMRWFQAFNFVSYIAFRP